MRIVFGATCDTCATGQRRRPVESDHGPRTRVARGIPQLVAVASLVGLAALLPGCQAPAQPTGPTQIVLRIPDYDAFVDGTLSVLRRYEFPPDHADRLRGVIVSKPSTSGQWFEPWRVDSRGAYQLFEASIHTMRRVVSVQVEPLDAAAEQAMGRFAVESGGETQPATMEAAPDQPPRSAPAANESAAQQGKDATTETAPSGAPAALYRVIVRVDKSRYAAPERQITTASGALAIYSARVPTEEGARGEHSRSVQWVPLGRDPLLEEFFLDQFTTAAPDVEVAG